MIASKKIAFGTDGWRAVMAREFTFDNVALVAQAIADHVNGTGKGHKGVIVGYDARFLSEQFAALVADVLGANGIPALVPDRDTPTPVVVYTIKARDLAGAVMLTASHNPPEYNGIKFIPDYLHPALPEITDAITARITELQADPSQVKTGGPKPTVVDPKPDYFAHIRELIDLEAIGKAGLTICVDSLYATGRGYVSEILKEAGVKVFTIHDERNPLFGGSLPEPNEKNLQALSAMVKEKRADLGLSMDGDADRFGMVDKTGQYITSNQVITLTFWHWAKSRYPNGGAVVRTVATSGMVDALAKHFGVTVHETPVGFKWVGNAMRTYDAIVGGEESGGLSVKGHIPEKDGILADLVITEMVAKTGKSPLETLEEIEGIIGEYLTTRVDVTLSDESKRGLMTRLREDTPTTLAGLPVASSSKVDGVKMVRDDGSWLLIRPSGTEPLVRCYIEARSEQGVEMLKEAIHTLIPDGVPAHH
jgi:alpha-D-glucose phosphate-specific phosphoglucomutase